MTENDALQVDPELSINEIPLEQRFNLLLRYCKTVQTKYDLLYEENEDLYKLWQELYNRNFRNEELIKQNSELRKLIKEKDKTIADLTLKSLVNLTRK